MRNNEIPINADDFFGEKIKFEKKDDDLVVIEKPNNGEIADHQEIQETVHPDRLKKIRKNFKEEIKKTNLKNQKGFL